MFFSIFVKAGSHYYYGLGDEFAFYIFYGFFIFPLSLLYNYFINSLTLPKDLVTVTARIMFAAWFLLIMGLFIDHRFSYGYYLGPYRELMNIIALFLSGIFIELLRMQVVKVRMENSERIKIQVQ